MQILEKENVEDIQNMCFHGNIRAEQVPTLSQSRQGRGESVVPRGPQAGRDGLPDPASGCGAMNQDINCHNCSGKVIYKVRQSANLSCP